MNKVTKITLASVLGLFAFTAQAATVVLDGSTMCSTGSSINGIAVTDVTGNSGGASECWGTFDGNDPGPSGDGFDIGGTVFNFIAKQDIDSGGSTGDIGLVVTLNPSDASMGDWSVDSTKFAPAEFLIVLKAANSPGYAAWLFTGADASSDAGTWLVAWGNAQGNARDLSHLSVYASAVPVPAAVWLFGSGLLGLVGIARRRA